MAFKTIETSLRRSSRTHASKIAHDASSSAVSGTQRNPASRKRSKAGSKTHGVPTSHANDPAAPWYTFYTRGDKFYDHYMSEEWGKEKASDRLLFEKLCLEGAQAGLSWRTILYKREAYRRTFRNFHVEDVASMTEKDAEDIIAAGTPEEADGRVVKHPGKIRSVIHNAKIVKDMHEEMGEGSFGSFLWSFVDHRPILNRWKNVGDIPSQSDESRNMSKALKKKGFKFVGPTTCYAFMQSCGFVIDHPSGTPQWIEAEAFLKKRKGGYQKK
mmetsp:Transcript_3981/g.7616  ORF Transcript_3981/g.7616 Transcript_3981/m.7616 type:complete len:271 (-) Transcript_3981:46-858(-)